jgi:hypothetical protein
MVTALNDQEKLVPEILSLFGDFPDDLVPTAAALQHLRSTIDSAVHFYYFLKERALDPLDINSELIDDVLLDLTAYATFFWHVRSMTRIFPDRMDRELPCVWEHFRDLQSLKTTYFTLYEKLISEGTPLKERYLVLLQLTKVQLIFAGIVFA